MMHSFVKGMEDAREYKDCLARLVISMFGEGVLKEHSIVMEGFSKTGHRINIPITESMLLKN